MAKTYGKLPSEVLANATTFDLKVLDLMLTWEKQQYDKAEGKVDVSVDQMQAMLKSVRKDNNVG